MSSSGKSLTVFLGALVIVTLLAFLTLSSVAASFAWMAGGGYGSGPNLCQTIISNKGHATLKTTPSSGGSTSTCVPATQIGSQVVAMAQAMADALYVNPACDGRISYPDCYYTWYKAPGSTYPPVAPTFPLSVIQYGEQVCSLPDTYYKQAVKLHRRYQNACCVRSARQSATPNSFSGTVSTSSKKHDCKPDAGYLRARAVPAERYSCRGDPRDQSVGVAHDGYRLLPDARPTTWPERVRAASDLSECDPQSNWLRC